MDSFKFYCIFIGCLFLASVVASSSECRDIEKQPSKFILCYTDSSINFKTYPTCHCSHLVVPFFVNTTQNNANITLNEEMVAHLKFISSQNGGRLRRILSLTMSTKEFSPTSAIQSIISSVARMIDDVLFEGVEIHWQQPSIDDNSKKDKANLVDFMKELHAVLKEKVIVTSTPNSVNRTIVNDDMEIETIRPLILLRLPTSPEQLVKGFDLKPLMRMVDLFVVSTHNIEDSFNVTYHHSRLMGISDILNTDSVLDLITSMGVSSDRVVAAVPTFAVQFRLRDVQQNLPGSNIVQGPNHISNEQLHSILEQGNWTIERDDDLTGAYAYSEEGYWIAFDDDLAAQIKAKYFLLRDIAGVAMMPGNTYDWDHDTRKTATSDHANIMQVYYEQFLFQESSERTRRQLAETLQSDISSVATVMSSSLYNNRVRASPYRIVRIVSRSGETSVIRQSLEIKLQCSRQGYYRHPEDCGRFYRCVKFDQFLDDFTVFEYDCPEGLVFDERYEVCTWPSQAAPCGGSSEILPVPMNKFVCPGEGYFADPENCRWFFACRDYTKDGVTFTQYEFRCPFGLLFDEENLLCNWPWLVPQCSGKTSLSGSVASSSNINVIKPEEVLEKKSASIPIGSPGYLSGKLVTGEGLYKDPRPVIYGESVVSVGCVDCQSAGLTIKEPSSPGSYSGKQLILSIPATTIAGESTPVRIIVASPAYTTDQKTTSITSASYLETGLPQTEAVDYNSKSILQGSNTVKDINQSHKYIGSLLLSGSSDPLVSYTAYENHGEDDKAKLPNYSQLVNKYDAPKKVSEPGKSTKLDEPLSNKDTLVRVDSTSALGKPGKDELVSTPTPYYLVKSGNGDNPGPENIYGYEAQNDEIQRQKFIADMSNYEAQVQTQEDRFSINRSILKDTEYLSLTSDPVIYAPSYSLPSNIKIPTTSSDYSILVHSTPSYPSVSVQPYSTSASSAPVTTKKDTEYKTFTTAAPVNSAPAYSEKASEFKNSTTAAPVYPAPAYTEKDSGPKTLTIPAPVYSTPSYTEKVSEYKFHTTAVPVYSAPAYTEKALGYKIPTTGASVYSASAYTEKTSDYKTSTTVSPVYSTTAYIEKASEYKDLAQSNKIQHQILITDVETQDDPISITTATVKGSEHRNSNPAYSSPEYSVSSYTKIPTISSDYSNPAYSAPSYPTYSAPLYSTPDSSAPVTTKKSPEYKTLTTSAPVYSAPTYTENITWYKTPITAAPVYSAPAYTEKAPDYKTPITAPLVYSAPAYTEKSLEYKTPAPVASVYSTLTHSKTVTGYKIPTTTESVYSASLAQSYTTTKPKYDNPIPARPVYSASLAQSYTTTKPKYDNPIPARSVYSASAYTRKPLKYNTQDTDGISGTRGSDGVMSEIVNINRAAFDTQAHSKSENNPEMERPSLEDYKNDTSTYPSIPKYPNAYEASSRSDTFGLKEMIKSKEENTAPILMASKLVAVNEKGKRLEPSKRIINKENFTNSGSRFQQKNTSSTTVLTHAIVRMHEKKGTDNKNEAKQSLPGFTFRDNYRESKTYENDQDSVFLENKNTQDSLINDEGIVSYGNKKILVKVPSTNKAALLDKWTKFNPSVVHTDLAITEQKDSIGGYKSSPHQPINGKTKIKSKSQEQTSGIIQPNVKLIDSSGSSPSIIPNKNYSKELSISTGEFEYGHRYLEKITNAQATAKNETLGPEVCVRAGLFRHPSDCQKFYECYWDRWIHQYTVHIFKCPVHLVYDDYITACNWPLDGPACVPHEAVNLYAYLSSTI